MEYALAAMRRPGQTLYILVDSEVCGAGLFRPFGALSVDAPGDAAESHDDLALGEP
jgi:hypothetical protein